MRAGRGLFGFVVLHQVEHVDVTLPDRPALERFVACTFRRQIDPQPCRLVIAALSVAMILMKASTSWDYFIELSIGPPLGNTGQYVEACIGVEMKESWE
jgi:hypothetical protein